MGFPIKHDHKSGEPLAALSASDLNTIANMLNNLTVIAEEARTTPEVILPGQDGAGWQIRIPTGSGSALPSNAGKSKWMVPTLSADNLGTELEPAVDNPALWTVDWIRAHA